MDYGVLDYGDMNWLAILCAGLAYWLPGAIWYSALFSKAWRSAIERHGVKLGQRGQSGMATRLIVALICNLFAALVLARVIHSLSGKTLELPGRSVSCFMIIEIIPARRCWSIFTWRNPSILVVMLIPSLLGRYCPHVGGLEPIPMSWSEALLLVPGWGEWRWQFRSLDTRIGPGTNELWDYRRTARSKNGVI